MKELRLIRIHGKVQGVGYRAFATRVARRLGLKGSIQNHRDGTVEAMEGHIAAAIAGRTGRYGRRARHGHRHVEQARQPSIDGLHPGLIVWQVGGRDDHIERGLIERQGHPAAVVDDAARGRDANPGDPVF